MLVVLILVGCKRNDGRNIAFRTFQADKGPLHVGVTYATNMGQAATMEATTTLINTYQIRCLTMCGVCAGRRDKGVNLGDVIIADRVWDYDAGKMTAEYDGDGNRQEGGMSAGFFTHGHGTHDNAGVR